MNTYLFYVQLIFSADMLTLMGCRKTLLWPQSDKNSPMLNTVVSRMNQRCA